MIGTKEKEYVRLTGKIILSLFIVFMIVYGTVCLIRSMYNDAVEEYGEAKAKDDAMGIALFVVLSGAFVVPWAILFGIPAIVGHLLGSLIIWLVWDRWFGKKKWRPGIVDLE